MKIKDYNDGKNEWDKVLCSNMPKHQSYIILSSLPHESFQICSLVGKNLEYSCWMKTIRKLKQARLQLVV